MYLQDADAQWGESGADGHRRAKEQKNAPERCARGRLWPLSVVSDLPVWQDHLGPVRDGLLLSDTPRPSSFPIKMTPMTDLLFLDEHRLLFSEQVGRIWIANIDGDDAITEYEVRLRPAAEIQDCSRKTNKKDKKAQSR